MGCAVLEEAVSRSVLAALRQVFLLSVTSKVLSRDVVDDKRA